MRHAAKVDWWIGAALGAGLVVPCVGAITTSTPWGYAVSGFVVVLVFGFCWPQWYETAAYTLIIRAGLTTRRIPYSTITSVRPSSDTSSSLAMSLDRVEIEYGSKRILIAPKNQETFFSDIASRAPQLSRQGQNLEVLFAPID
ncbi:MAG: PH domain-containing protein [Bryobacteraceae bacterium]